MRISGVEDRFPYRAGVQIGTRDFEQVYAGDINGDHYDDVVAVYDDGSFEIFLTIFNRSNAKLAASGGIGFHSMGVKTELVGYKITTVNFIGTLFGYGTNCRGADWGCTSSAQRAVFIGTEDTDDYVWVSPNVATFPPPPPLSPPLSRQLSEAVDGAGAASFNMDFSISFSPLTNTKHRTLSSARFYPDLNMRHQALAIGTGIESPNSVAYLGTEGFKERLLFDQVEHREESVAVSAGRISKNVNLICFANHGARNRCHRFEIDALTTTQYQSIIRLDYHIAPANPRPPPPAPPKQPPPPPTCYVNYKLCTNTAHCANVGVSGHCPDGECGTADIGSVFTDGATGTNWSLCGQRNAEGVLVIPPVPDCMVDSDRLGSRGVRTIPPCFTNWDCNGSPHYPIKPPIPIGPWFLDWGGRCPDAKCMSMSHGDSTKKVCQQKDAHGRWGHHIGQSYDYWKSQYELGLAGRRLQSTPFVDDIGVSTESTSPCWDPSTDYGPSDFDAIPYNRLLEYTNLHWGRGDNILLDQKRYNHLGTVTPASTPDFWMTGTVTPTNSKLIWHDVELHIRRYFDAEGRRAKTEEQLIIICVLQTSGAYKVYMNKDSEFDNLLFALYNQDSRGPYTDKVVPTENVTEEWLDGYGFQSGSMLQFTHQLANNGILVANNEVFKFFLFERYGFSTSTWGADIIPNPTSDIMLHPFHFDTDSFVSPLPGHGINTKTNVQSSDCRGICDATPGCNFVATVPEKSMNRHPGCYMFHEKKYGLPTRLWQPAEAVLGITYEFFQTSGVEFSERFCPLGDADTHINADDTFSALASTVTDFGRNPSVAFGEATDNTDIKIAFLDSDAHIDVITVSGRDHLKFYRGTAFSQLTGDFSNTIPETVNAVASNARDRRRAQDDNVDEANDAKPYSRFPGNAEAHGELANAMQLFVSDFDGDGKMDLFLHAPAPSAGSCAQRCHSQGRFGYDTFEVLHTNVAADDEAEPTYCFCGPHYDLMVGPGPPPSPPAPPPSPSLPPAPPPWPAPDIPPPSPPFPCAKYNLEQVDTVPHSHI
jgi:hypothetical protein